MTSLTKFRKLRLKYINLLDMLINKTVEVAIEKEIIKSKSIIVDAIHTKSSSNDLLDEIEYCQKLINVIEKKILKLGIKV